MTEADQTKTAIDPTLTDPAQANVVDAKPPTRSAPEPQEKPAERGDVDHARSKPEKRDPAPDRDDVDHKTRSKPLDPAAEVQAPASAAEAAMAKHPAVAELEGPGAALGHKIKLDDDVSVHDLPLRQIVIDGQGRLWAFSEELWKDEDGQIGGLHRVLEYVGTVVR